MTRDRTELPARARSAISREQPAIVIPRMRTDPPSCVNWEDGCVVLEAVSANRLSGIISTRRVSGNSVCGEILSNRRRMPTRLNNW